MVDSTVAIGFGSSITLTVDTTNVVYPPQTTYLKCIPLHGQTWATTKVLKIPFQVEIQLIPDCSSGWFSFLKPVGSLVISEPVLGTAPSATPSEELATSMIFWDIEICAPVSSMVVKFTDNDTVVDPNDFAFPTLSFLSTYQLGVLEAGLITYRLPTQQYGMRFNTSIYWTFEVITPAGNVFIKSENWMIKVCHDLLQVYWQPWPDPVRV